MSSGAASKQHHGIGINCFQSANGTDFFSCFSLHIHPVGSDLQHRSNRLGNRSLVDREFRAFGMNRTIQIHDSPTPLLNGSHCSLQKDFRVGSVPLRVRIRKPFTNVP